MQTGFVYDYLGADIPAGYLEADGAEVSRTTYAALFSVLGTTWGAGDGSTTFNLPDLRGRCSIGEGTGPTLTARDRGTIGGQELVQLQTSELPPHTHQPGADAVLRYSSSGGQYALPLSSGNDVTLGIEIPNTGGNGHHNNMPPYAVVRKLIKT